MSENGSIDSPPQRALRGNAASLRHLPVDFPLRTRALVNARPALSAETEAALRDLSSSALVDPNHFPAFEADVRRSLQALEDRHQARLRSGRAMDVDAGDSAGQLQAIDPSMACALAVRKSKKTGPQKPITTLVSALPETSYKDERDTSSRTLEYIAVQRTLLTYLSHYAADSLTPRRARLWTQSIEPRTKHPKAPDALRLCYYMRSQGFDTYAMLSEGHVSLFVVNQKTSIRHKHHDLLYWKQNMADNAILFTAPAPPPTRSLGRRNALASPHASPPPGPPPFGNPFGDLLGLMGGGYAMGQPIDDGDGIDEAGELAIEYDEDDEVDEGDAGDDGDIENGGHDTEQSAAQQRTSAEEHAILQVRMADAQATLDEILSANEPDPTAIEFAIAQVEVFQRRLDQA